MEAALVLDLGRAVRRAYADGDDDDAAHLLREIYDRKRELDPEMARFADLCDRFDNLYLPNDIALGGPSHWADDKSARTPGRAHVSLNVYPVYVDLPAALQAVTPIENVLAPGDDDFARELAVLGERLYMSWKDDIDFEVKAHKACTVKGLYGRTAAKVFWDAERKKPDFTIVDQPRNLYLGFSASDYTRLDWALYIYRITAEEAMAQWGCEVTEYEDADGEHIPVVSAVGENTQTARTWLSQQAMLVEVYDYWYREPKTEGPHELGKPVPMETWNALYIGNQQVQNRVFDEYKGRIPYVPLFNGYVPGVPDGRSELYDIEQIIREKDERLTQSAQLLHAAVSGQMWQLTGAEAPDVVPSNLKPKANAVVAPGAGNRIESIEPFLPAYQVEQHLARLDRELADVSGLNDLLRGQAPSAILSSSKAINALVSNYETRIRMKRDMFYRWRKDVWALANSLWAAKDPQLAPVLLGATRLDVVAPNLSPRDDMEASTMAANLVQSKLWSQRRGMDRVGVDDPEMEQDLIREERTDATLFPQDVQVSAQLLVLLQQMGLAQPPGAVMGAQQAGAGLAAEQQGSQALPSGVPSMNGAGEQPLPGEVPPGGGQPLPPEGAGPPGGFLAQTAVKEGEAQNRILSQVPFGQNPPGA